MRLKQSADAWYPISFPFGGLNVRTDYYNQPRLTTSSAQNVRGYDPKLRRLRGGQRAGLNQWVRWHFNSNSGLSWIQDLLTVTKGSASTFIGSYSQIVALAVVGGDLWSSNTNAPLKLVACALDSAA